SQVDRRKEAIGVEAGGGNPDRADLIARSPGSPEVRRGQLRGKVLVPVETAEHDRVGPSQIPRGHAGWNQAAGFGGAGGGRQQHVARQSSLPDKPSLPQPFEEHLGSPLESRPPRSGVRMARLIL